jgi:protein-S-isoprenylcysteine O-methyltransferase Ste14
MDHFKTAAGPQASRPHPAIAAVAWAGALLFVASLTYFLYAYVVAYGALAPAGSPYAPAAVNVALFTLFALHHSLLARTRLKEWVRRATTPVLERALYVGIASILFFLVCWCWQPVPGELYRLDGPWWWIGVLIQLLGVLLTIIAARALDVFELAGVRPLLAPRAGVPPLLTSGPFGVVRHPIYLGWLLFVAGAPDMTATRALFGVVSTAYLAMAVPWEERALVESFGSRYEEYRRRVKWRMLPGIY